MTKSLRFKVPSYSNSRVIYRKTKMCPLNIKFWHKFFCRVIEYEKLIFTEKVRDNSYEEKYILEKVGKDNLTIALC